MNFRWRRQLERTLKAYVTGDVRPAKKSTEAESGHPEDLDSQAQIAD